MSDGKRRWWAGYVVVALCTLWLGMFFAGLFVHWVPPAFIYLGYLLFAATGFVGCCVLMGRHASHCCTYLLCWALGAALGIAQYHHETFGSWPGGLSIIAYTIFSMVFTSGVHVALLVPTCLIASRKGKIRFASVVFYSAAMILGIYLPEHMAVEFDKRYPFAPEKIVVSSDSLADKNPEFIDTESMWTTEEFGSVTFRVNKSAAVIALDIGELEDEEKETVDRLFPTYKAALDYVDEKHLPVIPSVQMIDHKAKDFGDRFYAAIERYLQDEAASVGGGKRAFLRELLEALIEAHDGSSDHALAIAYVAAGIHLAGEELPELPEEIDASRAGLQRAFLSDDTKSRPVGFYAESPELQRIFQQDRFYQTHLPVPSAIAVAKVLVGKPQLREQYRTILSVYGRLTNPPSRFSVDDVADYAEHFGDRDELVRRMLRSEKWSILRKRGAGRGGPAPQIQLLPHSTSKENELFARIYNASGQLPEHNVMNRLIRAIRSGELDLTPDDASGWYDYQIHALETLLVPEKGREGEKLLLTKAYKERLIDAFKTILTKKRELHAKQVELIPTLGISLDGPGYFGISPDLRLEPTATYYLRTARGFRFVLSGIELLLGEHGLESAKLPAGESVGSAAEDMANLYYGLYLAVCEDVGMMPDLMEGELPELRMCDAECAVASWLESFQEDEYCAEDVRYIVPVLADQSGTQLRYWMTVGVRLVKVKAEYVRRPHIVVTIDRGPDEGIREEIPRDRESGRVGEFFEYRFVPTECFIPVEEFAEATGPARPLTRTEFRKLCDQCEGKKAVIRAIERQGALD
jgi:hypothetical protein